MYNMSALNQYQSVEVESKLACASSHNQISLLLEGALKKIAVASGAATRGDTALKGASLTKAIDIIDSLRAMLDHEKGGDISDNLEALYSYMSRRLVEANRKSSPDIMAEVSKLLNEIKGGWDEIPLEYRR